jgi:integrase
MVSEATMTSRSIHRLSALALERAKAGRHNDGGGLYFECSGNPGRKPQGCWVFRYERDGRDRYMGLGRIGDVSLAHAREKAADTRRRLSDGIDPIAERDARRTEATLTAARATTFDQCADAYIRVHGAGWRNATHHQQWRSTLKTYVSPIFGGLAVADVDTALVMKVLEPLWTTRTETAGRIRGRIECILDWAKVKGLRTGENPARWRGHLDKLLPKRSKVRPVKHHAALPYAEIAAFLSDLRERSAMAARALEFTILTTARTGETIGAKWPEVDFATKIWTVPASRMKAGKEHRVPLSDAAIAVLTHVYETRTGDYIFHDDGSNGPLSNMGMLMLLRRMSRSNLTTHGFRSSFRVWCAECTSFPREQAEAALAHAIGDKTEAAYQRGDLFEKRRKLMQAWGAYCSKPPAEGKTVVPFQRTAS